MSGDFSTQKCSKKESFSKLSKCTFSKRGRSELSFEKLIKTLQTSYAVT